jgi:drug/metabolite transporter (DMT)-like permease
LPAELPLRTLGAIAYLALFGSVLGFMLYYYLLRHVEAGKTALITLVTPVLALLLGALLNAEPLDWQVWLGTLLILTGLACHQWGSVRRAGA